MLPSSPSTVAMFAAHLQQRGLRASTIYTYLSAVSNKHKLLNLTDPTEAYHVVKTMQGIKNSEPKQLPQRLPITKMILKQIVNNVPFSTTCTYMQVMLRALFLLTYHACLRVGEAVLSNQKQHTLTMNHLIATADDSYQITFTSYKHSANATPVFLLERQADLQICPVTALKAYLAKRGNLAGQIFLDKEQAPVTRQFFARYLKLTLQLAGLPHSSYTTHSLRIGRATQLAMDGFPESTIKATGRWKSNAYLKYIRPTHFTLPN